MKPKIKVGEDYPDGRGNQIHIIYRRTDEIASDFPFIGLNPKEYLVRDTCCRVRCLSFETQTYCSLGNLDPHKEQGCPWAEISARRITEEELKL